MDSPPIQSSVRQCPIDGRTQRHPSGRPHGHPSFHPGHTLPQRGKGGLWVRSLCETDPFIHLTRHCADGWMARAGSRNPIGANALPTVRPPGRQQNPNRLCAACLARQSEARMTEPRRFRPAWPERGPQEEEAEEDRSWAKARRHDRTKQERFRLIIMMAAFATIGSMSPRQGIVPSPIVWAAKPNLFLPRAVCRHATRYPRLRRHLGLPRR